MERGDIDKIAKATAEQLAIRTFVDKIRQEASEEESAEKHYYHLASEAEVIGLTEVADLLSDIAKDEGKHYLKLMGVARSLGK